MVGFRDMWERSHLSPIFFAFKGRLSRFLSEEKSRRRKISESNERFALEQEELSAKLQVEMEEEEKEMLARHEAEKQELENKHHRKRNSLTRRQDDQKRLVAEYRDWRKAMWDKIIRWARIAGFPGKNPKKTIRDTMCELREERKAGD